MPTLQHSQTGIQIIVHDQFAALRSIAAAGLEMRSATFAEISLPFTHVEKGLAGNRYANIERAYRNMPTTPARSFPGWFHRDSQVPEGDRRNVRWFQHRSLFSSALTSPSRLDGVCKCLVRRKEAGRAVGRIAATWPARWNGRPR